MATVEELIEKILAQRKDFTREQVQSLIEEKKRDFDDLLSDQGAARLAAEELLVETEPTTIPTMRIHDLVAGLNNVTLSGKVISVDSIDNGKGQYRILVQPDDRDPDWPGAEWPEGRFLRQGVRAHGWVLLNRVPLWFEAWRRMNAFPPVVSFEKDAPKDKPSKPPKVGKTL